MKNDPEIFSKYDETFKKQQNLGIVKQVEIPGKIWQTHYLSPHGIIYEYKDTTKLSIIFDATSKTCNVSLNYCLSKRPSIAPLIFNNYFEIQIIHDCYYCRHWQSLLTSRD